MAEAKPGSAETVHTPAARSIREIVFGVNDGLVSITGLIVGVTASHLGSHQILVAALAAIAAATVAMGLGAYLSTQAQNEYFQSEWEREWREVHEVPDEERREVEAIVRSMGLPDHEAEQFTRRLMADKYRWVDFMMKEELGIVMDRDSPWRSAGIMAVAVIAGSIPPIVPYILIPDPALAIRWAIGLAFVTAFGLGWTKAAVARGVWWKSGLQFVAVAAAATVGGILAGQALTRLAG